jgi:hypothetical protein
MFAANEDYPGAIFGFLPQFSVGAPVAPTVVPTITVVAISDSTSNVTVPAVAQYTSVDFEVRPK